jgi:predicted TPR repeat methyltransferase
LCGPVLRPYAARLVGIDLSAGMIRRAETRGNYDELTVTEITQYLAEHPAQFDLMVSADTLVYFGELSEICQKAWHSLRSGGWLVFTVEELTRDAPAGFVLQEHGRYAHRGEYVAGSLIHAGFEVRILEQVSTRHESGKPVPGLLVVAERSNARDATASRES